MATKVPSKAPTSTRKGLQTWNGYKYTVTGASQQSSPRAGAQGGSRKSAGSAASSSSGGS